MKKKFFLRLLLIFLAIILCYSLLLTSVIYYKDNRTRQALEENRIRNFIEKTKLQVDQHVKIADDLVNVFINNSAYKNYIYDKSGNWYYITQLYQEMNKYFIQYLALGYYVSITRFTDDTVVDVYGTNTMEKFYSIMGFSDNQINDIENFYKSQDVFNNYLTLESTLKRDEIGTVETLTIIRKQRLDSNTNILFFTSIFKDILFPTVFEAQGEYIGIYGAKGWLSSVGTPLVELETGWLPDHNKTLAERRLDNEIYSTLIEDKMRVYYTHSSLKDWKYAYVAPDYKSLIINKSDITRIIKTNALLILVSIIIVLVLVNKIYRPIDILVKKIGAYGHENIRDEFSLLESAFISIQKNNENLNRKMSEQTTILKSDFLNRLIRGVLLKEEIIEKLKFYKLEWLDSDITLIILKVIQTTTDRYKTESILHAHQAVLKQIKQSLDNSIAEVIHLDYGHFVLIVKNTNANDLKTMVGKVIDKLETDNDYKLVSYISKPCNDVFMLPVLYDESLTILNNEITLRARKIITYEDYFDFSYQSYYYTMETEMELINNAVNGNEKVVCQIVDFLIDQNLVHQTINDEAYSQFISAVIVTINRILQRLNINAQKFFPEGSLNHVELCMSKNSEKLRDVFKSAFTMITTYVNKNREEYDVILKEQFVSYIEKNFHKDLSLEDMASDFNYSTSYFSRLFTDVMGENFKTYINNYRINIAKKIIKCEEGPFLIKDLAKRIGFNNPHTFIRLFQIREGVSPGKYIKNNRTIAGIQD